MKKNLMTWLIAVGAVLVVLAAVPSQAALVEVGDIVTFSYATNHPSGFTGGAFTVKEYGVPLFDTFCLEYNEYISLNGAQYEVIDISNRAYEGGTDLAEQNVPGDPISSQTAMLYSRFLSGMYRTADEQRILQYAIWVLEDERKYTDINDTYDAAVAALIATTAGASGNYGIAVMNIGTVGSKAAAQSQLVYVPEPGTLLLLGAGLLGLAGAGLRKRFRK